MARKGGRGGVYLEKVAGIICLQFMALIFGDTTELTLTNAYTLIIYLLMHLLIYNIQPLPEVPTCLPSLSVAKAIHHCIHICIQR